MSVDVSTENESPLPNSISGTDQGTSSTSSSPPLVSENRPSWLDRLPRRLFIVLAATTTMLVTLFFFFPRVGLWCAFDSDLSEIGATPEVNRARAAWNQAQDPYKKIEDPSNRPLQWRLLFPMLGYYLHLPRFLFFSLPIVGCWAAAAATAYVLLRESGDRWFTWWGTLLALGCDWFFTSTGWLSYNDAWTVLGITSAIFFRPRMVLAATCLAIPWIDERFLIVVPACWMLRRFVFDDPRPVRALLFDGLVAAAGCAPYVGVRYAAVLQGRDVATDGALHDLLIGRHNFWVVLEGAWMGLRLLWVGVAALAFVVWKTRSRLGTVLTLTLTALIFLFSLYMAGDISRSASSFAPVGVVGLVLAYRSYPAFSRRAVVWLAAASCVLPATHVIDVRQANVYRFFDEMHHLRNPIEFSLNSRYHHELGTSLALAGAHDAALKSFDRSIELEQDFDKSRMNRVIVLFQKGDFDAALVGLNDLLRMFPRMDEAYYIRAMIYEKKNRVRYAYSDYLKALEYSSVDWHGRKTTEEKVQLYRSYKILPELPPQ